MAFLKQTIGKREENEIHLNRNKKIMWKFLKKWLKKLEFMLEAMDVEIGTSQNSLLIKRINLRISSSM